MKILLEISEIMSSLTYKWTFGYNNLKLTSFAQITAYGDDESRTIKFHLAWFV